jgi:Protein of unknown function (DUF2752)
MRAAGRMVAVAGVYAALRAITMPAAPRWRLCGFHWLTGRPCPLCGVTRGLCELAKGHWRAALHFNLLSPLAFAMLFALFWTGPVRARLWTLGLAAFAAYGVCRVFLPSV